MGAEPGLVCGKSQPDGLIYDGLATFRAANVAELALIVFS